MRLILVVDSFPPQRTSCAIQIHDLSTELVRQGHDVSVIIPSSIIQESWCLEFINSIRVLRLRSLKFKDVNFIRRTIAELLMPFMMIKNFYNSPLAQERWDGVVWYSPSIFHGPFVKRIKQTSGCRSYLIIRDIFPEWAVDMGLIARRGFPYFFFNAVAQFQYCVADVIGVQSPGNLSYFKNWSGERGRQSEVLQNWLSDSPATDCSISINDTKLAGRKILVYAGNIGVAQGVRSLIDLADILRDRLDIGFLFVGRGSDLNKLRNYVEMRGLSNVIFHDEINPEEIPGLYAQCKIGLVSLDPRHRSHNIPGKFLSYIQAGLPVLASINSGNDLFDIIARNNIGRVSVSGDLNSLEAKALQLLKLIEVDGEIKERCRNLYLNTFSPETAARQVVSALGY